uniref:Uncharacterized protein n=1 Tax=Octopus bimaculoides TaxID=37653 RepID=A0A0L8FUW0_OCTBM
MCCVRREKLQRMEEKRTKKAKLQKHYVVTTNHPSSSPLTLTGRQDRITRVYLPSIRICAEKKVGSAICKKVSSPQIVT